MMPDQPSLTKAALTISEAASFTEVTFLELGERLEASSGILDRLGTAFEDLLAELQSDALHAAVTTLSQVIARVSDLGRADRRETAALARLHVVAKAIFDRVARMSRAMRDVDALVISARMAPPIATAIRPERRPRSAPFFSFTVGGAALSVIAFSPSDRPARSTGRSAH